LSGVFILISSYFFRWFQKYTACSQCSYTILLPVHSSTWTTCRYISVWLDSVLPITAQDTVSKTQGIPRTPVAADAIISSGFGHATRVSAFASHLLSLTPPPTIYIVSSAPKHVFSDSIAMGALYRFAVIDPVIVQPLASVILLLYGYSFPELIESIGSQISRRPPEERRCA